MIEQLHRNSVCAEPPEQKRVEDGELAQAEKILNEAIQLYEGSTKDLVEAKRRADMECTHHKPVVTTAVPPVSYIYHGHHV